MADVTYTGQIVREAPEIEAYKLGLLEEAKKLTGQTLTLPAIQAAGLSGLQQQASSLGQQGIGAYVPYIQSGSQAITGASAAQQAALSGLPGAMAPGQALIGTGATATYNPATAAQAYMNPYQQQVTQNALAEMQRQAAIQQNQAAAQAVGAGAFGGTREGVQRAEMARGLQDVMSQRILQDYSQNYLQAQQAATQAFQEQAQRQMQGGQSLGTLGLQGQQLAGTLAQGLGSLGVQQAALGQAASQLGAQDVQTLSNLGAIEQQAAQTQLDAARATALQQAMSPYQRLAYLSDIYKGAPSSSMTMTSQSAPSASPLQTALGLGVGALSAAAGIKQSGGLFG
jgi:hypothetical protein